MKMICIFPVCIEWLAFTKYPCICGFPMVPGSLVPLAPISDDVCKVRPALIKLLESMFGLQWSCVTEIWIYGK